LKSRQEAGEFFPFPVLDFFGARQTDVSEKKQGTARLPAQWEKYEQHSFQTEKSVSSGYMPVLEKDTDAQKSVRPQPLFCASGGYGLMY